MQPIAIPLSKIIKNLENKLNEKEKNKRTSLITIKQCQSCGKIFGYIEKDKNYQLCDTCEKKNNFNDFIKDLNIFKNNNK